MCWSCVYNKKTTECSKCDKDLKFSLDIIMGQETEMHSKVLFTKDLEAMISDKHTLPK